MCAKFIVGVFIFLLARVMTVMGAIPNCVRVLDDVLNGLASVSIFRWSRLFQMEHTLYWCLFQLSSLVRYFVPSIFS